MKVSCLCPTYNRVPGWTHLLEEAIESFLRQDYKNKELLILNDNPAQSLQCDAPDVTIINLNRRFSSLGEKYNALVALANGKLLAPWEDDDISLPWRLSTSIRALAVTGASYYNPRRYWFYANGVYHHKHPMGVGHSCSVYTKSAFDVVRGYKAISGAQDSEIDTLLRSRIPTVGSLEDQSIELNRAKWFFIHRWDTGAMHLSGNGGNDSSYKAIGQQQYTTGTYKLTPHWRRDYLKDIQDITCRAS